MEQDSVIYAARLKNRKQLYRSSSGGMFTAISDHFLQRGGAVICSVYCYETNTMNYVLCTSEAQRNAAIGSKYIQSNPNDIFKTSIEWLDANPEKQLVFFGVGCHAAAYQKYVSLKGYTHRVLVVDIICHGGASPLIWHDYLAHCFSKKKINDVTFKDKRYGWLRPTALVLIGKKEIPIPEYIRLFYGGCILRPCCAKCPYCKMKRGVDITIGDFWNIERTISDFFDEIGTSVVLLHTIAGKQLFTEISEQLDYRISNEIECWQPNLSEPTKFSVNRDSFWADYAQRGFRYVYNKYAADNLWIKAKKMIKRLLSKAFHL